MRNCVGLDSLIRRLPATENGLNILHTGKRNDRVIRRESSMERDKFRTAHLIPNSVSFLGAV